MIIATKTKKARRYKITVKKFRILENNIILYVYPYNYYIVKSKAITYIQKILIGVLKKIITNTSMIEQRNIIQEPTAERIIFFVENFNVLPKYFSCQEKPVLSIIMGEKSENNALLGGKMKQENQINKQLKQGFKVEKDLFLQ